eukprot:Sspe_Gene.106929::Locus_85005_Transcript_1_1_Confidence_1.000_Length_1354::g.106929::m.106929
MRVSMGEIITEINEYKAMGMSVGPATYTTALSIFAGWGAVRFVEELVEIMLEEGISVYRSSVYNLRMLAHLRAKEYDRVRHLYQEMCRYEVQVSENELRILALADVAESKGSMDEIIQRAMSHDVTVDKNMLSVLISQAKGWEEVHSLLTEIDEFPGTMPSSAYSRVLSAASHGADPIKETKKAWGYLAKRGVVFRLSEWNSLMSAHLRAGDVPGALSLYHRIVKKHGADAATITLAAKACRRDGGRKEELEEIFRTALRMKLGTSHRVLSCMVEAAWANSHRKLLIKVLECMIRVRMRIDPNKFEVSDEGARFIERAARDLEEDRRRQLKNARRMGYRIDPAKRLS